MTIVEFLNARLDEDEKTARTAGGDDCGAWTAAGHTLDMCQYEARIHPSSAAHIARHDPARVLREVAAKRKAVVEAREASEFVSPRFRLPIEEGVSGYVLRLMAVSYADHPDYRREWKL